MGKLVSPKVFLVGFTDVHMPGVQEYLEYTGQQDFLQTLIEAIDDGITPGEALCSMYAKLCYKSLVRGKNANVTRVRDVRSNLENCHETGHGSVFEHCSLNFIVTDCSRVYTHEQVRHRPGWAYSQTSGRYCRLDSIDLVWDSVLDPVKDLWFDHLGATEDLVYLTECRLGLRKPNPKNPDAPMEAGCYGKTRSAVADLTLQNWLDKTPMEDRRWVPDDSFNFDRRKQITSAIRRIAPNGQANEMGMTVNIRGLRHAVQMRTARFAETEIRNIFNQVYGIVKGRFPTIFHKAKERMFGDYLEIYGMKMNPYDVDSSSVEVLKFFTPEQLQAELLTRTAV